MFADGVHRVRLRAWFALSFVARGTKNLKSRVEIEVCLQCHLETTTTMLPHDIQRPDRGSFSCIPGQPLGDLRLTFDRAGGMGDRFEVAHAAYRMRLSQCFLKSGLADPARKLRCTTCHDPHNIPRGEQANAHCNGVCRTCHAAAFEKPQPQARTPPTPNAPPVTYRNEGPMTACTLS